MTEEYRDAHRLEAVVVPPERRELVMGRLVLRWVCVCALVALPLVGCSEETAAAGGSGGSGDTGGDGGSGGSAGDGGSDGVPGPGTLLSAEEIDPFASGMKTWRVLYTSEAIDGTPIEISGIVSAPSEPPQDGLRDVVTYAHGTTGLFDGCAPSAAPLSFFFTVATPALINAGYVAVATDYEGLGTPGDHPYLVGASEGRGVLDIVRAAQQIDETHASSRAVVWGWSQGGHAALFAGEIAPDWAPEIEVLGVAPAAPASELDVFFEEQADVAVDHGFMWMVTLAYEATYPGLNIEELYDAETLGAIRQLVDEEACLDPFLDAAWDVENAGFVTNPVELPSWRGVLVENSPGYELSQMPILVLQGSADQVVPQSLTDMLFDRLCEIGSQTDYRVFEGLGHGEAFLQNFPTMLEWTNARFAGEAASDTCPD